MDSNEIDFCEDHGYCICGNDCMTGDPYLDGMDYIRLEKVLGLNQPLVYSPRYLALASADYGDRAYILACDFWRAGERRKAAWCGRVFKTHKALYDALEDEVGPRNLCPYCTHSTFTDQEMAAHINQTCNVEPEPVTAANWWHDWKD